MFHRYRIKPTHFTIKETFPLILFNRIRDCLPLFTLISPNHKREIKGGQMLYFFSMFSIHKSFTLYNTNSLKTFFLLILHTQIFEKVFIHIVKQFGHMHLQIILNSHRSQRLRRLFSWKCLKLSQIPPTWGTCLIICSICATDTTRLHNTKVVKVIL